MSYPIRLVNQQIAFTHYHLQQIPSASAFTERCQQQAALLQLGLGLEAYAQELLAKTGLKSYPLEARVWPQLFSKARDYATQQGKISADLAECAELAAKPSWLCQLLSQLAALHIDKTPQPQSVLLNHTSLTDQQSSAIIASSNARAQNAPPEYSLSEILAEFEALIARQRAETAEY